MLQDLPLNANALMSLETYYHMYKMIINSSLDEEDQDIKIAVTWAINGISEDFEKFCNRTLKARTFSYNPDSADYNVAYSTFDPPPGVIFWFPTFPVNSITRFLILGTEIIPSTNNLATDGYILYNKTGKLVYEQGFERGYYKTIQVEWNGGYAETSYEMSELQMLCFKMVNSIMQSKANPLLQGETIGGYQYQLFSPTLINSMRGLSPDVYASLGRYRREVIG